MLRPRFRSSIQPCDGPLVRRMRGGCSGACGDLASAAAHPTRRILTHRTRTVVPTAHIGTCSFRPDFSISVHRPACVIMTTLSRTVILPTRDVAPSFVATVKATGLSPDRGMLLVMVIQGTSD